MKYIFVQLGRIGDMILLTGAIAHLKAKQPDAVIDVLAGSKNHIVLANNPHINKVIIYKKTFLGAISTLVKLRSTNYDYWIDHKDHYSNESNLFAQFGKARHKIGFRKNIKSVFNLDLYGTSSGLHYSQLLFRGLNYCHIQMPNNPVKPEVYPNKKNEQYVSEFLEDSKIKKYIVINISASNPNKMWQTKNWIDFIKIIKGTDVIICYDKIHSDIADEICMGNKSLVKFQSNEFNDLFPLIRDAELLITPDTSLVHIASAFNTPLLALYSGLDDFYDKFAPINSNCICVRADKGDSGIQSIKIDAVITAFNKIFNEN